MAMRKHFLKMTKIHRQFFLLLITAIVLTGCMGGGGNSPGGSGLENYPYERNGKPVPDPHDGLFVSDHGTMRFNGDGKSIVIDFDEELSELLELPQGEQEGSYMFLTGDLPPFGSMDIWYDMAHEFSITVSDGEEDKTARVGVGMADENGRYTGTDCTTADRITMFVELDGTDHLDFLKDEEAEAGDEEGEAANALSPNEGIK